MKKTVTKTSNLSKVILPKQKVNNLFQIKIKEFYKVSPTLQNRNSILHFKFF